MNPVLFYALSAIALAGALGAVGSLAAVLPLKEIAESSRFGRDLRRAARQAPKKARWRCQPARATARNCKYRLASASGLAKDRCNGARGL